jgi:hypothetical protein
MAGEAAGIDALDAEDVPFAEVVIEAAVRTPVAGLTAEFTDHEAAHVGLEAFIVFGIDAVVPDERVRHGHDLASVRGIGENLLVSGHGGIEAGFSGR